MTERPEIKVGQRWVTLDGLIVRILSTSAIGTFSVCGQFEESLAFDGWCPDGFAYPEGEDRPDGNDLISLAPQTVTREVALYRWKDEPEGAERVSTEPFAKDMLGPGHPRMVQISEPLTIEFTLLPGESAE